MVVLEGHKSKNLEVIELSRQCFERCRDGESIQQIASSLHLNAQQVVSYISKALRFAIPVSQESMRLLEIARMEEIGRILMEEIADTHAAGRVYARTVEMYIRASEHRAKLAQLDKVEVKMRRHGNNREQASRVPVVIDIVRDPGAASAQSAGEALPPPAESVG